jgi:dihydropteroate synthase
MIWRGREFEFVFPRPALVMGIVNVTPDSFSDGGRYLEPERAIEHGLALAHEGADVLDVGGESTRPRAERVGEAEELRRVLPVIRGLRERAKLPISIDTQKPAVAREALAAGAAIVNDIAANRADPEMWDVVAAAGAGYVLMHMQGTPQTMQIAPSYGDVVEEVSRFFEERMTLVTSRAVPLDAIVLDPGIGFGKTVEHNLQLLAAISRFSMLARPVLLGASRKSFIGKILGAEGEERLPGSIACAVWAVQHGARIIRTHDVLATIQGVRMIEAIARHVSPNGENDEQRPVLY